MESVDQPVYSDVNTQALKAVIGGPTAPPLLQRVSDGMLRAWYTHVTEFFPLQAQQFTRTILRTLEMHRECNDYLQGQLDKVMALAFTSQQTGSPVDANALIVLTGVPVA